MSPTDDHPALSDTWMTVPEAATVLGCSPRTVERRVARGELRRQERDGRVLVAIPESLRRPADRMVEAVQQDAAHMRQLSAAVTQATEQAGMVLREAVAQARADAASAIERAVRAEQRVRQAWRVSAALATALVGAVSVTVTVWVVTDREAARARQVSDTPEPPVGEMVPASMLDAALRERDERGADIMDLQLLLLQRPYDWIPPVVP